MMLIEVEHQTVYTYDNPVNLAPTLIRLTPRPDPMQRCLKYSMKITPKPSLLTVCIDPSGNSIHTACFTGDTQSMIIDVAFAVETTRSNPFDFIITDPDALMLPFAYASRTKKLLLNAMKQPQYVPCDALADLVQSVLNYCQNRTLDFLTLFSRKLSELIRWEYRENGPPRPVSETLLQCKGSCRDTAMVFIEGCRMVGLAARFVSGYCTNAQEKHNLHGWAEVYLPGAGWRGFDPGSGLAIADTYVACVATPFVEDAAPVEGTYFLNGKTVCSQLETSVKCQVNERLEFLNYSYCV